MFMYSLFRFTRRMKTGPVLNSPPAMDIKSFFGLESTAEKIAMKQYATSIKKVCVL